MRTLNYLVVLPLAGWAVCSVIAADTETPVPTPDPVPIVTPGDTGPEVTPGGTDTDVDDAVLSPAKEAEKVQTLAKTYGVTEQQVLTMRQTRKMGWGEINNLMIIAQRMSTASGDLPAAMTMDEALATVLQQRQSGMGLGQIANANKVKLGDIKNADKTGKPAKVEKVEKASKPEKIDRPQKPMKPEKIEKPERPAKPEKVDKPDKPEKPDRGR